MDESVEARTRELDRLSAIAAVAGSLVSSQFDSDGALYPLLEHCLTLTGASGAAIDLLDGDLMHLAYAAGTLASSSGLRRPVDDALTAAVAFRAALLFDEDVPEPVLLRQAPWRAVDARSLVAAPLVLPNDKRGALVLVWNTAGASAARDIHTLQIMAGFAGAILSRGETTTPPRSPRAGGLELVPAQTLHDEVTGLPNHSLFLDRLGQAIQLARREDTPLAILLFGLHEQRALAEQLGAAAGDAVLRSFAGRLRETLRASDTTARVGAHLFAVLLPGANAVGALGTAKKLQRALSEASLNSDAALSPAACVGIAVYPDHGDEATTLLQHAEAAAARAQRDGLPLAMYEG